MQEFEIIGHPLGQQADGISFAPANLREELAQNCRCILSTRRKSVPLDRRFGFDGSILDRPQPAARLLTEAEIVTILAEYEPRLQVSKIEWTRPDREAEAADGALYPKVLVTMKE